jgi:hypothetical protein
MINRIASILGLLLLALPASAQESPITLGEGRFFYSYPHYKKPIPVWYSYPPSLDRNSAIFIVMHGNSRTAKGYRDAWKKHAHKYGFLLLVPEFSKKDFPGSLSYHLGNRFRKDGKAIPEHLWTFSVIDPLFEQVKSMTRNRSKTYTLYGHSAGSQFVHRFLLFKSKSKVGVAIAANAGWYTLPEFKTKYPYGLRKSGAERGQMASVFRKRLVIFLGDRDIDPKDPLLRTTKEAILQGNHRLERGHTFFRVAQGEARSMKVPFLWSLQIAPGVAHSNSGMATATVRFLFESK